MWVDAPVLQCHALVDAGTANMTLSLSLSFSLSQTHTHTHAHTRHLRLYDGVAAIERRFTVFVPPVAAAAFAALKLLPQFGDLRGFTHRHTL